MISNDTLIGVALFTKTQQRVLGLLYGKPDQSYYFNEIVRLAGVGKGTVKREIDRLVGAGLLSISHQGNQTHYQANSKSHVFKELMSLVDKTLTNSTNNFSLSDDENIVIGKTVMVSREALKALSQRAHISRLTLFGSAARGELTADSDIDLLVEFEKGNAPSLGGIVKLKEEFSTLLGGRKIDLATTSILKNPYRGQAIRKDMVELYAA